MKTTFERELHKIFDDVTNLYNKKYVGRAFYASIDNDLKLKAEYISTGLSSQYNALRVKVLHRDGNEIDANTIRFEEAWGRKQVENKNFANGVSPHMWEYDGKVEWYVYQPTERDFDEITMRIMDYVEVFQDESITMENSSQGMSM